MKKGFVLAVGLACASAACAVETETVYLSGHGKDDAVPWSFFCTGGMRSNVWTTIPIPSCWEQQGFGAYGYQVDPLCESGRYRLSFGVPAAWKGKTIRLVFEGAMTDTEVWINGRPAGPKHQGGFYRFAYDITRLVTPGSTNLLEATVDKHSSDEGVNRAERTGDYWNFGGIFRPVYLEAVPKAHIARVAVDARADGSLGVEVFLAGNRDAEGRVRATVEGLGALPEAVCAKGADRVTLNGRFSGQKNWTAETPNLYRLRITFAPDGGPTHDIALRIGFRTIEVREGQGVFVNGQRVMLKGACRHSFWPESGRTLSEAISRADVALLKEMNMNAVRMSHYPPDAHFLDTCDELGLYVLDELSGWQKPHDTEVGRRLVGEMLTRDINHPSILFWDNGNEGGWNTELDGDFAKWDPQGRHVLHPWAVSQGVNTAHYRNYDTVVKSCASNTVYMPTEFMHALYDGGGGAGLDDYWEAMRHSQVCAGGFIWALLDEGVARTDKGGRIDVNGNRAPDGLVGPHREREGSFYTVREIWCPVQARLDGPISSLTVENRYDFLSLDECRFDWSFVKFPTWETAATGTVVLAQGSVAGPKVAPHETGKLELPLPDVRNPDALQVMARDPAGRDLWTWSWLLRPRKDLVAQAVSARGDSGARVRIAESAGAVSVTAGALTLAFDAASGRLSSVVIGGHAFAFANGPRLVASATQRVNVEQGKGKKPKKEPVLRDLSGTNRLVRLTHRMEQANAVIEATYDGVLRRAQWTVRPDGWARLCYAYRLDRPCDLAGVQFDYPEAKMKSVRWLGQGPYRVWKNRLKGTRWGVWSNAYNDTVPGESWIFPEFKGYFGDWIWASFDTEEGRVTLVSEDAGTYLGVYRPNEGTDPTKTRLYTPQTGLAVFDAIPPIGTKFAEAAQYGPQSQPNPAPGLVRRTVWLRFEAR